ncbi:hypothetical protein N8703_04080 [Verrucomicrobia bacterium]|nr:hypothetical protein [Verrucomicrobiota bacterium]
MSASQEDVLIRNANADDILGMLEVYYDVEKRSDSPPMDGFDGEEMLDQLRHWIQNPQLAICLVSEFQERITGFVVCLLKSTKLATLEIFVTDPRYRKDFRKSGKTRHSGEHLFRSICEQSRSKGIESLNTLINLRHYDFRRQTRFLLYRGFEKTNDYKEFEYEL